MMTALAFLVIASLGGGVSSLYLETFHTGIWKVPEDMEHAINISLRFNTSQGIDGDPVLIQENPEALLVVTAVPDEDWKLKFLDKSVVFTAQEVSDGVVKNIIFSGYYWGLTQVSFYLTRNDLDPDFRNGTMLRDDFEVVIDRGNLAVDSVFIAVAASFMLFNNINMGAQLDLQVIKGVLKKPLGPICGFLSQFIFMPTLAWLVGRAFFSDPLFRLGLFTYGCCPGGTSSNTWTLMFNGDLNLSITMTTVSILSAMGMMPLWMFTLGASLLEENNNIQIPFSNLAGYLAALTIPVGIGIILRLKKPTWADKGRKIIKPFALFMILFFMTVGTYNSHKVVLMMSWQMFVAGVIIMSCGYTLGALLARLMCLSKPQIIAVSIETALQNSGVAFVLLKLSLDSPFSDLAALPAFATMMMSGPPLILVYFIYLGLKRCCGCCPDDPETKEAPSPELTEDKQESASFLQEKKDVDIENMKELEKKSHS